MNESQKKLVVNLISSSRAVLLVPIILLLSLSTPQTVLYAFGLFLAAAATDFIDGRLARYYSIVSIRGIFIDSIMDRTLMNVLFVYFAITGWLPFWMVALNLGREFCVQGFRAIVICKTRHQNIKWIEKSKIVFQGMTVVAVFLAMVFGVGVEILGGAALVTMGMVLAAGYYTMIKVVYDNRSVFGL